MIQVIIIDENEVFRVGLRAILGTATDMKTAAEASTLREALVHITAIRVDVIVTGLSSTGCAGMELLRHLKKEHSSLRVIVVTAQTSAEFVRLALKAGVAGYLTRDCSSAEIIGAVQKVAGGGIHRAQHFADGLRSKLFDG